MADKFKFDLNRMSYRELTELDELDATEVDNKSIELLAKVLVDWPFDKEIEAEVIKDLGLKDFLSVQRAFRNELDEVMDEGKN